MLISYLASSENSKQHRHDKMTNHEIDLKTIFSTFTKLKVAGESFTFVVKSSVYIEFHWNTDVAGLQLTGSLKSFR